MERDRFTPESVHILQQTLVTGQAQGETDPAPLLRLMMAVEVMVREIGQASGLEEPRRTMGYMMQVLLDRSILPVRLAGHLANIRNFRNMLVHSVSGFKLSKADVAVVQQQVLLLFRWYLADFPGGLQLTMEEANALLRPISPVSAQPPKKKIFLCYAKEDHEKVEELYETLKQGGHSPWMDKNDLLPGQDWEAEIRQAIEEADFFIACMSQKSVAKKGFVQKEVRFALDVLGQIPHGQIFLIPLRLEPCNIPRPLASLQWIDIDSTDFQDRLFRAIEK